MLVWVKYLGWNGFSFGLTGLLSPQKNLGSRLIMPLWTRGKTGASRDKPGTCRDKTGTGKDKTGTSSTFSCFVHVCPYFFLSLFSPHLDYLFPVCPSFVLVCVFHKFVLPSSLSWSSYSSLKASMHTSKLIFVFFFLQSIIQRIRFAQNLTVVNLFYKECSSLTLWSWFFFN